MVVSFFNVISNLLVSTVLYVVETSLVFFLLPIIAPASPAIRPPTTAPLSDEPPPPYKK